MLSPHMAPSGPRRSKVPLVAAAVATVVLVPFIIKDLGGDEEPEPVASVPVTTTTQPVPESTDVVDPSVAVEVRSVVIDPAWLAKGTSVFGESEAQTKARIDGREATTATPESPATVAATTTRPVGDSDSGDRPATTPAPTRAPTTRAPAPTTPPTSPPKPTPAPTTAPPTTAAAPTTAPPAPAAVGTSG